MPELDDQNVPHIDPNSFARPYLVIPKLIEQPTWGGEYIASTKGWKDRAELVGRKIGQSYELFSGSNLSLCGSSDDPDFMGEVTDRDAAQLPSSVPNSIPLARLVEASAESALGREVAAQRGHSINLLIKFTQALGNSFQVHPKDGQADPYWKPKSESWYFFEPGLLTLGVKSGVWQEYQAAAEAVDAGMRTISEQIKSGQLTYEQAKPDIQALIQQRDPWQFVNIVQVTKDELIDLSAGGVHHSWEEDLARLPLGNVLYELQTEAMDDVSTLRSFDRGKIGLGGALRDVHIADYFRLIDRSPQANDPATYARQPEPAVSGEGYTLTRLLAAKYYGLQKLVLQGTGARYTEQITQFRHLFAKSGRIRVTAAAGEVMVGAGHSCFVPAAAGEYTVSCESPTAEVLLSE